MVTEVLVEAAINVGAKLLAELDRSRFAVESMFWAQVPESHWRLVIGSVLVRESGPREAYERAAVLQNEDVGLDLMRISVFDPESSTLTSLLGSVETSGNIVAGDSWVTFADGVVYRLSGEAIIGDFSCELNDFQLAEIWRV